MKKLLLFAMLTMCGVAVMAQFRPAKLSKTLQNRYILETPAIDNQAPATQAGNPVVNTKSVMDDILGVSGTYDMQSNGSPMERVVCWPDGSVAASWIKADVASYADRGTGYNYFNGTTWGDPPTSRIETIRTGWPTMDKWNGNGEIVISHQSATAKID